MNQLTGSWVDMFRTYSNQWFNTDYDQYADQWKSQQDQMKDFTLQGLEYMENMIMQGLELQERTSLELSETAAKFLVAPEAAKEGLRWLHELNTEFLSMRRSMWEKAFDNTRNALGNDWSDFVATAADGSNIIDFMEKLSTQAFQTQSEFVSKIVPDAPKSASKPAAKKTTTKRKPATKAS